MHSLDAQHLNYNRAPDRAVIQRQSWQPTSQLLVLDEIHKMPNWKGWRKGVADGKAASQQLPVTAVHVWTLFGKVANPRAVVATRCCYTP